MFTIENQFLFRKYESRDSITPGEVWIPWNPGLLLATQPGDHFWDTPILASGQFSHLIQFICEATCLI